MAKLDSFIKENLECPPCGCVIVPDATKCPNCNTDYDYDEKEKGSPDTKLYPLTIEQK